MYIDQLKTIQQNFVKELQEANAGKKTSLAFIVHKLSSVPIVKNGENFEVLVIGGSVFKRAFCKKIRDRILIIKKEEEKPLTFRTENEFLKFIESQIYKDVKVLALNFAYPLAPVFENKRLDGILLAVGKEGSFHGLIGKKIGAEIEKYILGKRKKKIKVAVANDTVCLLLSGLMQYRWNKLAAGIVGTGLNFAFFLDKDRLVNLESANFDKFPQSKEGRLIDKESTKPGRSLFEKETAGAYLYKHFNLIIKEKKIDYAQISSTEELNRISLDRNYSSSEAASDGAESRVSEIARDVLKRSAQLVACQIAGIVEFKKRDMVFNMEGSLFWKGNGYKETVEQTVEQLVPKYNIRFVEIKDSAILGAAKLVS